MNIIVGTYIGDVRCENFHDPERGRNRVRPLPGQDIPVNLFIECSKNERESHAMGTHFLAKNVKVCLKPNGRIYLRGENQKIYKI